MSAEEEKEAPKPSQAAAPGAPAPRAPKAPPAPKLEEILKQPVPSAALDALREALPDAIEGVVYHAGEVTALVKVERLIEAGRFLRDDPRCRMNLLADLCAADGPKEPKRFEVNYHLYSIPCRQRIRLKVRVADGESVPSVTGLWSTANWHEREAFDLFGIRFDGHPDLTRILLPDDWKGHPLRKDYPLEGYPEQHPRFR